MAVEITSYDSKKDYEKYKDISKRFVIGSSFGATCSVITYGALISELWIPDDKGDVKDVMLGLKDLDSYMVDCSNHGSIVGRSANRIQDASFDLDGVLYIVPANDGKNNLHGGDKSFQRVFWNGEVLPKADVDAFVKASGFENIAEADGDGVILTHMSPDGSDGFPGNLDATVVYAWLTDKTLLIMYKASTDKATIFAPTNHGYFNLGGHDAGFVGNNILTIDAEQITLKNDKNCPDGCAMFVEGTIFDFRNGAPVSNVLVLNHPQTAGSRGIDSNFCVDKEEGKYTKVAKLEDSRSSRVMEVYTDMPGIQVYAGNHLGGNLQKGDIPYEPYGAICLEAQMYPNAINVPAFSSPVIRPGKDYYHVCGYKFNW